MQPPFVSYQGNGSHKVYVVPFPYLRQEHVHLYFGWSIFDDSYTRELIEGVDFTWSSGTTVALTIAPSTGTTLSIVRQTPGDYQLAPWQDGTNLVAEDLNTADLQCLYLVQELLQRSRYALISGNARHAETATKLATPRAINGVPFDGTKNITVTAKPDDPRPKVYYVRSDGDNAKDGRSPANGFRHIEEAISRLHAAPTPEPWTVVLLDGLSTNGEISLPDHTTILGSNGQRRTPIIPVSGREKHNVFRCGNGCQLMNLKFAGWQIDDFDNPTVGFAMVFRPDAIILPGGVPYGQNCTVSSLGNEVPTPLPTDPHGGNPAYPKGGGCVLADAEVLSPYTVYPNIMTWGFTPSVQNGIGYVTKNRGFINPVNAIGVGAHRHFMCLSGGQMIVSGSSSQFGDYSFWSEGSTMQVEPLKLKDPSVLTSQANGGTIVAGLRTRLIDDMWAFLVANHGAGSWPASYQELTRKDAGLFLDAMAASLVHGFERPMLAFAEGMFGFDGGCVYPPHIHAAIKASWDALTVDLAASGQLSPGAVSMIHALTGRLKDTMDNYWHEIGFVHVPGHEKVRRKLRSLITAINHQWTGPMAGVEFYRVPPARSSRSIRRSIMQRHGGRVRFSGQDDAGNAVFVGGLEINARSGQLGGPPFDAAVRSRITRAVLARSF